MFENDSSLFVNKDTSSRRSVSRQRLVPIKACTPWVHFFLSWADLGGEFGGIGRNP